MHNMRPREKADPLTGGVPSSPNGAEAIEFVKQWCQDRYDQGKPYGLDDFRRWYANPAKYEEEDNCHVQHPQG